MFTSTRKGLAALAWVCLMCLSAELLAQGAIGIAGRHSQAIRLNMLRPNAMINGAQQPPYAYSAAYLRNAFGQPGENSATFLLDSALCGIATGENNQFSNHLKAFYSYDGNLQLSSVEFRHENQSGVFENFSRKRYVYENGRQTQYLFQLWDATIEKWKDDYQEQTTYDGQGRWTEFVTREQNEAGEWVFLQKKEMQYDQDGNAVELTVYEWNNNDWQPKTRAMATYNENGFYTQVLRQSWNGTAWEAQMRETATYDDEGIRWLGYLCESYNADSGQFKGVAREWYSYNRHGFWIKMRRQEWDDSTQAWEDAVLEEFSYTRRGIWIAWSQMVWKDGAWENSIRQVYQALANRTREDLVQEWNAATQSWTDAFRNLVRYDEDGNVERQWGTQEWNEAAGDWENLPDARSCFYAWSPARTTAISKPLPRLDCAIANPYRLHTPIYCSSLEAGKTYTVDMMDIQGRTVYSQRIQGGQLFSVDRPLTRGIYHLRIQENGQLKHIQKLVVTP